MKAFLRPIRIVVERCIALSAFGFPVLETSYYFGQKTILATRSVDLKLYYLQHLKPITDFYESNIYLFIFAQMMFFWWATEDYCPLSFFARYNIVQATLINILVTTYASIYIFCPIGLREGYLASAIHIGWIMWIYGITIWSAILLAYGRYAIIPVVSESSFLWTIRRPYEWVDDK